MSYLFYQIPVRKFMKNITYLFKKTILGINESIVKGICKILLLTLPRYRDSSSRLLVRTCLVALLEKHTESSIKCLTSVLSDFTAQYKNLVAT